ncbi:hypothetical protein PsYK624_024870 [Phanerochaete sordida]|uniref:Uncharacterized protein n=1 Tax=Phanerochaete sordida TaxID=48140 RepID=A0A9P3FZZ7_9APHY|nr:hypothetical protein PsYK624_024870 [Phanerochaete sordida]
MSAIDAPFVHSLELNVGVVEGVGLEGIDRLCQRDMLPPLPLSAATHLSVSIFANDATLLPSQVVIEGSNMDYPSRGFELDWLCSRDDPVADMQTIYSILDTLCRQTGPCLQTLTLDIGFDVQHDLGDIPLHLPFVRHVTLRRSTVAIWVAQNSCSAPAAPTTTQWTELEEVVLDECVMKASTMLDFVDWCNNCFKNPTNKLRTLRIPQVTVKVNSDEVADEVLARVRSMREHDIILDCPDIHFWYRD